jgi:hypothetical protein
MNTPQLKRPSTNQKALKGILPAELPVAAV